MIGLILKSVLLLNIFTFTFCHWFDSTYLRDEMSNMPDDISTWDPTTFSQYSYALEYSLKPTERYLSDEAGVCPPGFSYFPFKDVSGSIYIKNDCALDCLIRVTSDIFRGSEVTLVSVVTVVNVFALVLIVMSNLYGKVKLGIVSVVMLGFSCIATILMLIVFTHSRRVIQCHGNTVVHNTINGMDSFCIWQSVIWYFCFIGMMVCWCVQMINIFLVVVMGIADTSTFRKYYLMGIFLIPSVITILFFLSGTPGFSYGDFRCHVNPFCGDNDIIYFFYPLYGIGIFSSLLMIGVIGKAFVVIFTAASEDTSGGNDDVKGINWSGIFSKLSRLQSAIKCLSAFLFILLGLIIFRFHEHNNEDLNSERMLTWVKCIFYHYYVDYPSSGSTKFVNDYIHDICGVTADMHVDLGLYMFHLFVMFGHGIILFVVYFSYEGLQSFSKTAVQTMHNLTLESFFESFEVVDMQSVEPVDDLDDSVQVSVSTKGSVKGRQPLSSSFLMMIPFSPNSSARVAPFSPNSSSTRANANVHRVATTTERLTLDDYEEAA